MNKKIKKVKLLKTLRESRKLSQDELAKKIGVTIDDINTWENDYKQIPKTELSSLAYTFGVNSEELIDYLKGKVPKLTTSYYFVFGDESIQDGWWGHFGICLNGQTKVKWFPISLEEANKISNALGDIDSKKEWMIVETLNNRILVFKPVKINQLWLLDEASDQIGDEWEMPWDGYEGKPAEFYRVLEEYICEDPMFDDKESSNIAKHDVEIFTDIYDLGYDQVRKLVIETQIYNIDGIEFSYDVDEERLVDIIENINFEDPIIIFDLSNEGFDLYMPADNISLIDMPKRRVDMALREINDEN